MPMLLRKPLPYGRGSDWSCGYVNRSRDRQGRLPGERIFSRKVGQAIALCGLFEWAFGPRNPMKNWSSRIGGADPLVRGRRPRWPAGAPQDADVVVSAAGQGRPARTRGSAPPGPEGVVFRPCQSFPHHELSTDDTRRSSVLPRRVTLKFQLHLRPDMSYLSI